MVDISLHGVTEYKTLFVAAIQLICRESYYGMIKYTSLCVPHNLLRALPYICIPLNRDSLTRIHCKIL